MKKIILSVIILSSIISCKKEDNTPKCEKTVAGIAANYKLTKVEAVSASGTSDITATALDPCQTNSFYSLKTDKTFTYTQISSTCLDSGSGNWDVTSSTITISGAGGYDFTSAPIESWDCTNLKITKIITLGSNNINARFTFVKQ